MRPRLWAIFGMTRHRHAALTRSRYRRPISPYLRVRRLRIRGHLPTWYLRAMVWGPAPMTDALLDEIEAGRAIARRDQVTAAAPPMPPIAAVRAGCAALRCQVLGYIVAPCSCDYGGPVTPCAEAVAAAADARP